MFIVIKSALSFDQFFPLWVDYFPNYNINIIANRKTSWLFQAAVSVEILYKRCILMKASLWFIFYGS